MPLSSHWFGHIDLNEFVNATSEPVGVFRARGRRQRSDSLGFTDYPSINTMSSWYKSVNFGAEMEGVGNLVGNSDVVGNYDVWERDRP